MAISIGAVTRLSSSSGASPGARMVTSTCTGATSGKASIGDLAVGVDAPRGERQRGQETPTAAAAAQRRSVVRASAQSLSTSASVASSARMPRTATCSPGSKAARIETPRAFSATTCTGRALKPSVAAHEDPRTVAVAHHRRRRHRPFAGAVRHRHGPRRSTARPGRTAPLLESISATAMVDWVAGSTVRPMRMILPLRALRRQRDAGADRDDWRGAPPAPEY